MGSAMYWQLGNPQAKDMSIATVEGCLKSEFVKEISAGSFHVAVLTTKGKVYTWGKGENGRLGLGDTRDRNYPKLVGALEDRHVHRVACGSSFTAAICSHKSISSKDQSVCSRCQMIFGFTRKKHNCCNCWFVFCHSCSSNKSMNPSFAPTKGKRYRVCVSCFAQLEKPVEPRIKEQLTSQGKPLARVKSSPDTAVSREESLFARPKCFLLKFLMWISNLFMGKQHPCKEERNQQCQYSFPPFIGEAQRWGQVSCPSPFRGQAREFSNLFVPMLRKERSDIDHAHSETDQFVSLSLLPKASSNLKQDSSKIDKMLSEELKRLHAEAILLAEQYEAKDSKLCQYKCRVEEAWALARDKAAKCKAAKDVIKVLTNQRMLYQKKSQQEHKRIA